MKNFISVIIFIISLIPFVVSGLYPNWVYSIIGIVGLIYILYCIGLWVLNPIERDRILVRGDFLLRVIFLTISVPYVATMILMSSYNPNQKTINTVEYEVSTPVNDSTATIFSADHSITLVSSGERVVTDPNDINSGLLNPIDHKPEDHHLFWSIYYHFIDPGNQHMASTPYGHAAAAVISIIGLLLLNGLLITTLLNYFDRCKNNWDEGEIRYNERALKWRIFRLRRRKFAVVIGAHNIAPTIIRDLLEDRGKVDKLDNVILLTSDNAKQVREVVESYLTKKEREQLIIYNGQLDSPTEIEQLYIEHASEVYILGELRQDDKSQSYHDTQCFKCARNIAMYLKDLHIRQNNDLRGVPLLEKKSCHVLFEYQTTYAIFQFSDVSDDIKKYINFIPFNTYENWARYVLVKNGYTVPKIHGGYEIKYAPLDGYDGIQSGSDEYVHFVIVGMSKMGVAMAIQAAQIAHYPNFKPGSDKTNRRTRITFIDTNAYEEMNYFKGRYQHLFALARHRYVDASRMDSSLDEPWFDPMSMDDCPYKQLGPNFIDIEWEFIKGNVQDPAVIEYLNQVAKDDASKLSVAVCLPLSNEAIAAALYMPQCIYRKAIQVLVYQRESSNIIYDLHNYLNNSSHNIDQRTRYHNVRPFGMNYANFTVDLEYEDRAKLCVLVYDIIFSGENDIDQINTKISSTPQDVIDELWEKDKIFNKLSNIYLASSFETKLRCAGCNFDMTLDMAAGMIASCDSLTECEHNRWCMQQLLIGFRAYTDEETIEYLKPETNRSVYKKNKKNGFERAHVDICSFEHLALVDKDSMRYNTYFNNTITTVMKLSASKS